MNKFKVGDVVWWSDGKSKLSVRRFDAFMRNQYFCTNDDLTVWGYFSKSEIKPIQREYAILGDA